MAVIIPYGDGNAHGTLYKSLTFRRHRGIVVLEKKPHPRGQKTTAQQLVNTKFKAAWSSYRELNPWEIYYLQTKAAELGMTPSTLYIQQYMKNEIASAAVNNMIKEIISLSCPEVVSAQTDGLKHYFKAWTDNPSSSIVLSMIQDNNNVISQKNIATAYNRATLEIARPYAGALTIPSKYPIVMEWKNFSDEVFTSLIRLPQIIISETGVPSTTNKHDIKRILEMEIVSPISGEQFGFGIKYGSKIDSPSSEIVNGEIDDNDNIAFLGDNSGIHNKEFIEFADNQDILTSITDGYQLRIVYLDLNNAPHEKYITLPTFTTADGGPAVNTFTQNMCRCDFLQIFKTIGSIPAWLTLSVKGFEAGAYRRAVQDNSNGNLNIFIGTADNSHSIEFSTPGEPGKTIIKNYSAIYKFKNLLGVEGRKRVHFPAMTLQQGAPLNYRASDDGSLWDGPAGTTLINKGRINKKRFWIADDWTLYHDEALTQVAKAEVTVAPKLYLSTDFSLYYDQAMTQLAMTPYY